MSCLTAAFWLVSLISSFSVAFPWKSREACRPEDDITELVLKKRNQNYCNNRKTSASISLYFYFTCFRPISISTLYVLYLYRHSHVELQLRLIGRHVPALRHGKHDLHSATTGGAVLAPQAVTTGPLSPIDRTGSGGAGNCGGFRCLWLRVV